MAAADGHGPDPALRSYQQRFARLIVNVRHGRASPHKICMLLAALDMARAGALPENRIRYAPPLLERYRRFFDAVRSPGDHPNPFFPFFHLSGRLRGGIPGFWHLHPLAGREAVLGSLSTARSHTDITANVAWASLDPQLHRLLQEPASVDALAATLAGHWFGRGLQDLDVVVDQAARISRYERSLRGVSPPPVAREPAPPESVRSPAFRRVVTQAYDFRCAASGLRLLLPTGESLVEAAHIHPFAESADDDPRNGLALTPDLHWAMDRNLIAPGPDYQWHVSPMLDRRIADLRFLCELDRRPLLLPAEPRMYPRQEGLAWRMERLRDTDWTAPDVRHVV